MTDLREKRGFETDLYEPAEDSHLLATTCVEEIEAGEDVLDVGTGTGVVAAHIRDACDADVVGVDINPVACRRARTNDIPTVRGHLVSPFACDVFDVVVSNPPYLPTAPDEIREDWMSVALSGGPSGRKVVTSLLEDVSRVLRPEGRVYLLVSSLMDVQAVRDHATSQGFTSQEISRDASFPFEVLSVLCLEQTSD